MSTIPPIKLAVLISGSGTTLVNLVDRINNGHLNAVISLVIGSREGLKGLDRAKAANLPTAVIDARESDSRNFSRQVFSAIDQAKVDLVCLAGWLCLLEIPTRYEGKILNIHPSLLPSFGGKGMYGLKVHQAVLDRGCTVTGCTVHYVTEEIDAGAIILQASIDVDYSETPWQLGGRVFKEENRLLVDAVRLIKSGAKQQIRA